MLPTIKQWKNWSLPSKYTAIGLCLTIASLVVALYQGDNVYENSLDLAQFTGTHLITSSGEQEVYYGVEFSTPPKLEIIEGSTNPDRFSIIKQRNDSFTFVVNGSFTLGTPLVWQVTGRLKSANK